MLTTIMTMALAATVGATHTDTTFSVPAGARLALRSFQGDIVVRPWSKSAIRIQAEHDELTWIEVAREGDSWEVQSQARRHRPAEADYVITAPPWLALDVEGVHGDVEVDGWKSDVIVQTVNGDVSLKGGEGLIQLSSVTGAVSVVGARGRLQLSSVQDGVDVRDAEGEINVEAVGGDIVLDGVRSRLLQASSVNGDIVFAGSVDPGGRYKFETHSGDLDVKLPPAGDATVSVSTFAGDFETSFPVQLGDSHPSGHSYRFTLGSGKALIDLESFMGTINLDRLQPGQRLQHAGKDDRDREARQRDRERRLEQKLEREREQKLQKKIELERERDRLEREREQRERERDE